MGDEINQYGLIAFASNLIVTRLLPNSGSDSYAIKSDTCNGQWLEKHAVTTLSLSSVLEG